MPGFQLLTKRKFSVIDLLKLLLAIFLMVYVLTRFTLSDIPALWSRLSLPWLVGAAITYFLTLLLLGFRYWLLIEKRASLQDTVNVSIVQALLGNYIATSAGAVYYVSILRTKNQVPIRSGIGSLLFSRITDLFYLFLMLSISTIFVWDFIEPVQWLISLLLLGLSGVFLLLVLMLIYHQLVNRFLEKIQSRFGLARLKFFKQVPDYFSELITQVHSLKSTWFVQFLMVTNLYFFIWFSNVYCNMRMFALDLNALEILFILSLSQLIFLIPLQVLGGIGISEVTFMYLSGFFGIPPNSAVLAKIGLRVVYLLIAVPVLGYLLLESLIYTARRK